MKIPLSVILPGERASEACCTCATVLSEVPRYSPQTEKPYPADRRLDCCPRVICGRCIHQNARFASYCPYCQVASDASSNPLPQGLREPPSYDTATSQTTSTTTTTNGGDDDDTPPPPYKPSPHHHHTQNDEKSKSDTTPPDTLHFIHPTEDSIPSLSLRYGVPAPVLRRHNNITSDHLLSARRTLLVPGSHYPSGVSLSPRPVGGEAEEARKARVRRWMVACRCASYDAAELYLAQAGGDLGAAVERYLADEEWERANPLEGAARGKGKGRVGPSFGGGGTWAAQAAFLKRQGQS